MKLDLSIYNRILFNDLRPWLPANQSENKFKEKLIPAFKTIKINSQTVEKNIKQSLKDYPNPMMDDQYVIEVEDTDKEIVNEILTPLIVIDIHSFFNFKTEFYYYLITNVATRLMNNLNKAILTFTVEKDQKYWVNIIYRSVYTLLHEADEKLKSDKNDTKKSSDTYILAILKTTLVRLAFEIQELFPELLASKILTEDEIYDPKTYEIAPSVKFKKDVVMMNNFKVRQYIFGKKYTRKDILNYVSKTIEIIAQDYEETKTVERAKQKGILIENIEALENLYCLLHYKYIDAQEGISYEQLTSEDYTNDVFTELYNSISARIEEKKTPNKRLQVIEKEQQVFSFLEPNILLNKSMLKNSIPRRVLLVLQGEQSFVKANLNVDFSRLMKDEDSRLKTNLSVPQLALLFKSLTDLNIKVFQIENDAKLYRFISSNFISKKSNNISLEKLRKLFKRPEKTSANFWITHLHTIITNLRKIK